jgi:hypothetical protein
VQLEKDPMVYARFHLPGTSRAWYAIEGEPKGEDFLSFGFVTESNEFREFRLSELEAIRGLFDAQVEHDLAFREGKLTDVVPAPDS